MDTRTIWAMAGALGGIVVAGQILQHATRVAGGTGSLKAVLPVAIARAQGWNGHPALVACVGHDLVDGRSTESGGWSFQFVEEGHSGRQATVLVGERLLLLREHTGTASAVVEPNALLDTPEIARRVVGYGMRHHMPATYSLEVPTGQAVPAYRISTSGRLAATWQVDARTGELLGYQPGSGSGD